MQTHSSSSSSLKKMGLPNLKYNNGQELAVKGYENSKIVIPMKKFPPLVQYKKPP